MSNKRITDLTELTTPTTDDVFPVVDIATNTTTKVQLGNLPVPTSVTTALATKQDTLVSGTNIKTVNSTSLVGSGNVAVQETLVSGTNIKTINSTSLLGSGNITIAANPSGVAGAIQFSNGSAFASDAANLFWDDTNNRLGVGTNVPTANVHIIGANQLANTFNTKVEGSAGFGSFSITNDGGVQIGDYTNNGYQSSLYFLRPSGASRASRLIQGLSDLTLTNNAGGFVMNGLQCTIKGSGSTSATTSLLVQNSSGVSSLQVTDDGSVFNYGKGAVTGNTAFGNGALINNTTGNFNSAHGIFALQFNTSGTENCAVGAYTLFQNISGLRNTAIGQNALSNNTTGENNTAIGYNARTGNFSNSIVIGSGATANGSNQFVVGSAGINAGAIDSSAFTQDKRWKVKINGVDYYIALQTA